MIGRLICVIFLSFFSVTAAGHVQSSQLLIKQLSLEEGLPNNKVNSIAQDKNGFMWFGTNDGLCRYDGFQISTYQLDDIQGSNARTPQIGVIKTDESGNLLIGSYTLFRYNYNTDQIEKIAIDSPQDSSLTIGRIHALETGPDSLFYFSDENGLFTYDPKTNQVLLISNLFSKKNYIISLYSDGDQLWIGTNNSELYCYRFVQKNLYPVEAYNVPRIEKNQLLCFYKNPDGKIWMGTQDNGLLQFDPKNSTFTKINFDTDLELSNRIRKIIHAQDGNIWLGTRAGLYLYENGVFIRKADQENPISTLSYNSIYDIFIDDHSTMWLGTFSGGVNYIHLNRKAFTLYKPKQFQSVSGKSNINCFAEDQQLNLWIGTVEFGLFFQDHKTGKLEQYTSNFPTSYNISNDIKALAVDSSGNVWAGTYDGLYFINRNKQQIINYNTKNSSICNNQIRNIQIDKNQNVWIGTNNGLSFYDNQSHSFHTYFPGLEIHPVYIDPEQNIWVGASTEGLFRFNPTKKEFENLYLNHFSSFIRSILVDSNNNLWIGNNKGLYFVNRSTDELLSFGLNEGLPTLIINGLLEDESKNLWISTGAGLLKCNQVIDQPEHFSLNSYTTNDGLQGLQFRLDACFKSRNGKMYFGGDLGYNEFFPHEIHEDYNTPKIALTDFKIYNKTVLIGEKMDGQVVLPKAINELKSIELSYKHRLLTIEFAALHYTNPMGNQYRYRLLPFQNEWVYSSGLRNFANFSNLKGGTYTFQLEVANSDSIWNPVARELKIKIHPPFWSTIWFLVIALVLISGILISFYFYRISFLKRNNLELENKVKERTKELKESLNQLLAKQELIEEQKMTLNTQKEKLQELNSTKDKFFTIIAHDLKNPFQSILGMSELLEKQLENHKSKEVQLFAREIFNSTNNIYNLLENLLTWSRTQTNRISLTPEKINVFSLISSSVQLLEKTIMDKKLSLNYEIETKNEAIADRNMIETVIRNLLSNAIKFTPVGGTITIKLKQIENNLEVSIIDSGIGISQNELEKLFIIAENKSKTGTEGEKGTGLGLIICKEFVHRNKGEIGVKSELHQGSTFYFTLPSFTRTPK